MQDLMHNSIWLEHPKYPGYRFSPEGNVLSLKQKKPRFLKKRVDPFGYVIVNLNSSQTRIFSRLLAEIFIPKPNDHDHFDVNHRDGNKENNNLSNLEWVTKSQNQRHRFDILKKRAAIGSKSGSAKLTEEKILEIRKRLLTCKRGDQGKIAKEFAVSEATISMLKKRNTWNHI